MQKAEASSSVGPGLLAFFVFVVFGSGESTLFVYPSLLPASLSYPTLLRELSEF